MKTIELTIAFVPHLENFAFLKSQFPKNIPFTSFEIALRRVVVFIFSVRHGAFVASKQDLKLYIQHRRKLLARWNPAIDSCSEKLSKSLPGAWSRKRASI